MAVQSKTLVNDLGSAVVDELASQLNRAISTCVVPLYSISGDVTGGSPQLLVATPGESAGGFLLRAHEDMFVVGIDILVPEGPALDGDTGLVLDVCLSTENTVAAPVPGANHTIFASDGAGPIAVAGAITSLADITAVGGGTGLGANSFTTVTGVHDPVTATSFAAFGLTAGQKIRAMYAEAPETPTGLIFFIHYRPMKDQLNLTPTFTQKTFATKNR